MANTIQLVSWTLGRKCPLRRGRGWARPQVARQQLYEIASYSRAAAKDEVFKGAWLTGKSYQGAGIPFPIGQVISQAFERFGGLQEIQRQCLACEANTALHTNGLAGCTGMIYPFGSNYIQEILEQKYLVEKYNSAFTQTNPLWYGLWIVSPLSHLQMEILRTVFKELADTDESEKDAALYQAFASALTISLDTTIPLHVEVAPPGHVDMGVRWTFPHCPRCKVFTKGDVGLLTTCHVCQFEYKVPKMRGEDYDHFEPYELENVLDNAAYEEYVREYWLSQGYSPEEIQSALEKNRKWHRKWSRD